MMPKHSWRWENGKIVPEIVGEKAAAESWVDGSG